MAGSIAHLIGSTDETPEERTECGWSLIENMRDARECVEELLYVVLSLADDGEIDEAMDDFYAFERGDTKLRGEIQFQGETHPTDRLVAYRRTKEIMERP